MIAVVYSRVVAEPSTPKRNLYKAAEACELAGIKPYVLRSWELEFPNLGVTRSGGGGRVYRQADLDQVLRIKQLVFEQGLTLGGARRRLQDDDNPAQPDLPLLELPADARDRIARVREGLRDLLTLLSPPSR